MIEIAALWKAEEGSKHFASGRIGKWKLILYHNKFKNSDKHPDFKLMLVDFKKKKECGTQSQGEFENTPNQYQGDEIPF